MLNPKIQEYIKKNEFDASKLVFSKSPFEKVTIKELIQQIDAKKKSKNKLPTWYHSAHIYYPPKLNVEQCSSEITAKYKASIIDGDKIADITGGFGIDSYYFSKIFKKVHHFELNKCLSEITVHNFLVLKRNNIQCFAEDGLKNVLKEQYDVIYADPSRRHKDKGKVFFLKDCEPDIPFHLPALLKNCKKLLIKTSPMLDISVGLHELQFVSELHILAVNNEVKELLWLITPGFIGIPYIKTININKDDKDVFNFNLNDTSKVDYDIPKKYLYEPNAAIMKSGAFNLIPKRYKVQKLHKHSHLYTSDELISFPGRQFIINKVTPYQKKHFKEFFNIENANISIRNFPESVAFLRKKLRIKDGGDLFLFFTTTEGNKKIILSCTKV
ncbi:MAG: class I SAM-dependent methyltransferase [Flavobacteriaceae bacterium]|nr:class I SAM-dependent methyltransferase [Flavobacteriaceae bacterium]